MDRKTSIGQRSRQSHYPIPGLSIKLFIVFPESFETFHEFEHLSLCRKLFEMKQKYFRKIIRL